jgi:hypothetical protein
MSNQQLRQNSVRAVTGTAYFYEDDWHALFDLDGIAEGFFNDRMLAWINFRLSSSYQFLSDAMQAFAIDQSATSWSELGTFDADSGGGTGPTGSGILLEDGTSFLLAEDASYLIQE